MSFPLRKLFFSITFNFSLFLILMVGIQNSSSQSKVNLIISETVSLPVGFIMGVSLISGSLTGCFLKINLSLHKE